MSITSLAGGTIVACIADRFPERVARLEAVAGVLLVFGFAYIGVGLAVYFH